MDVDSLASQVTGLYRTLYTLTEFLHVDTDSQKLKADLKKFG